MDTLVVLGLIPVLGFIIAFYLDAKKGSRLNKEKEGWEKLLGKEFTLEDLLRYHIQTFGKFKAKESYRHMVEFMNNINKNTSDAEHLKNKYLN